MAGPVEVNRVELADLKVPDYIGLRNVVPEGVSTTHISVVKTLGEFAFCTVMDELEDTRVGVRFAGTADRIARLPRSGFLEPVDDFVTLDVVPFNEYRKTYDYSLISEAAWSRTPLACETLTLLKVES